MVIMPYERNSDLPIHFYTFYFKDWVEIKLDINCPSNYDNCDGDVVFFEEAHDISLGILKKDKAMKLVDHLEGLIESIKGRFEDENN